MAELPSAWATLRRRGLKVVRNPLKEDETF
jgi:hypothetical protein